MVQKLKQTTAGELMSREVLTLTEDASIEESIALLEDYHITGAPVLNAGGECIGVFSVADVLKRRVEEEAGECPRAVAFYSNDPLSDDPADWASREDYDLAVLGRDTVGQWMTPKVEAVRPDAPLTEVCSMMRDQQIHRLLVMEGQELQGILTSFDVVRWVASR